MRAMTTIAGAALAAVLVAGPVAPAAAEQSYSCRCKGINATTVGGVEVLGRGCGNGFRGGDPGQVVSPVSEDGLHNMLPPYNRTQLIRTGEPQFSNITGWECRRL